MMIVMLQGNVNTENIPLLVKDDDDDDRGEEHHMFHQWTLVRVRGCENKRDEYE